MNKGKLSIEDFYHQFHGHEHHNDAGEYSKPDWHEINPSLEKRHKGLDLKSLRKAKRKSPTIDRALHLVANLRRR